MDFYTNCVCVIAEKEYHGFFFLGGCKLKFVNLEYKGISYRGKGFNSFFQTLTLIDY